MPELNFELVAKHSHYRVNYEGKNYILTYEYNEDDGESTSVREEDTDTCPSDEISDKILEAFDKK